MALRGNKTRNKEMIRVQSTNQTMGRLAYQTTVKVREKVPTNNIENSKKTSLFFTKLTTGVTEHCPACTLLYQAGDVGMGSVGFLWDWSRLLLCFIVAWYQMGLRRYI